MLCQARKGLESSFINTSNIYKSCVQKQGTVLTVRNIIEALRTRRSNSRVEEQIYKIEKPFARDSTPLEMKGPFHQDDQERLSKRTRYFSSTLRRAQAETCGEEYARQREGGT